MHDFYDIDQLYFVSDNDQKEYLVPFKFIEKLWEDPLAIY